MPTRGAERVMEVKNDLKMLIFLTRVKTIIVNVRFGVVTVTTTMFI